MFKYLCATVASPKKGLKIFDIILAMRDSSGMPGVFLQ